MTTLASPSKFLLPLLVTLLAISGCSEREAMSDLQFLNRTTLGCFQTSFSYAKNRHGNDLEKANLDFEREIFQCMVKNVLGGAATEQAKTDFSNLLKKNCQFTGLQTTVRTDMTACLEKEATPFVMANQKQLQNKK